MTSTLPQEVRDTFERFVTCELTTVDAVKQPITWPVTPYYVPGGPTIDVTTGLGYPKKADDAGRHPSVALLFSDATGSGIDSGIRVLVQGTATIDDRDLEANADRYLRESAVKLPATRKMPRSRAHSEAAVRAGPSSGSAPERSASGGPSTVHFSGRTTSRAPSAAAALTRRWATSRLRSYSSVELSCTAAARIDLWARPGHLARTGVSAD
jgi:hypothetical protein